MKTEGESILLELESVELCEGNSSGQGFESMRILCITRFTWNMYTTTCQHHKNK